MAVDITLTLSPQQAADPKTYTALAAKQLWVKPEDIAGVRVVRRSIDARSKNIKVNLGLQIYVDAAGIPEPVRFEYPDVSHAEPVIVVGAGPAGLFAALRLIELGIKPVILERGKDVSARKRDVATVNRGGAVDPDSNYAFGEGGAGAFSDGKLFTRSKKRGDHRKALEILHFHGSDDSILYDAYPHIGTDKLPRVIARIRETILTAGGEVHFNARLSELIVKDGVIRGVVDQNGNRFEASAVILATGHSARDVYEMLHAQGIRLEAKPFAMGVRVEHPQALVDTMQYHLPERGEYLPPASYSLASQVNGRGVYSFCMCPGGFVVPALTAPGEAVVNGMSASGRGSRFANAGVVTEIRLEDFAHLATEHGPLAGLRFQQEFERAAYAQGGGGQIVPAQRLADFTAGRASADLPATSYHPGAVISKMQAWMPPFIGEALRGGLASFGVKMRGFVTNEALLLGVESRTSSPVRIPRDATTLMHPEVRGLFPAGEGAGYAGGIVSSAVDGERCAEECVEYLNR